MYYETNVSRNGQHFFATDRRSAQSQHEARILFEYISRQFPAEEGFEVTASFVNITSTTLDL